MSVAAQNTMRIKEPNMPQKVTNPLPEKGKMYPDGKKMMEKPTFLKKITNKPAQ